MKEIIFELIKPFSDYKTGETFECFNGLICGISDGKGSSISFLNKEYFKPKYKNDNKIRT